MRAKAWLQLGLAFLVVGLLSATASTVSAQTPTADEINEVARYLSCPTCTGINVADCPTETCAQWRQEIGRLLAEGKSRQEILDYFAARYGDHVLQNPPGRGIFLWVWIVPAVAVIAGGGLWLYWMRRWAPKESSQESPADGQAEADDEYVRRVERDLERWKS